MRSASRYAFVVPRFGEGIAGGAETLVGALAQRLAARGDEIEVLTTCARDNRTWENAFPPGDGVEYGVRVKRFPVDPRNLEVWVPLQIAISEGMMPSVGDQLRWMENSVNSSALYEHIARKGGNYGAIFFAPYLFGTTFWGSLIKRDRSLLIPCLHNEHYAYVEVIQSMFRQIRGCLFNAVPEQELACGLYGEIAGGEVGMGFDPPNPEVVRELSPFFKEPFPYVLYVGRKETGKNVQLLVDHFIALKESGACADLRLVIAGGGSFSDLHRPHALHRPDIVDLEHVSESDKQRLIRHALCLCQPSTNESFSIVIMEAWLLGTPVVVHAQCPVTRYHALESSGGLYFDSEEDFVGVIETLYTDTSLREALARGGREYVESRYNWDAVLARFDAAMKIFR